MLVVLSAQGGSMKHSASEAARVLGISPRRVRALAAAGELPAERIGRSWVIELDGASPRRPSGRRLSPRSAWGALGLGRDRLSRSEQRRARDRQAELRKLPPARLAARAEVFRFSAHPSALARLEQDERLLLSGVSAAHEHGADIVAVNEVEAYVRAKDLEDVRAEYALQPPERGLRTNVVLRAPRPDWPFPESIRFAPRLVVAADLIDAGDERSRRAGRALLP